MNITQNRQIFSSGILRLVGYGLLLMALVDLIFLLIPFKFMNPTWEFQTMGAIIERIPVTLLGIMLVYYGERDDRAPIERFVLRWLSRASLVAAILLVLMIPLSITDSFRIYYQYNAGINTNIVKNIDILQNFKQQLKVANSSEAITQIIAKQSSRQIDIPESVNPQKLKTDIINSLQKNQDDLRQQSQAMRSEQKRMLLKSCLKWNLGALISACLFFLIWKSTLWARLEVNQED
jgi:hypothetical protein